MAIGDLVADPEIPAATVLLTALYVRLLQPPARGEQNAQGQCGETLFAEIGCASCHVPMMRTGKNPIPELSEVDAYLYSDLLLHDMGSGLADNRPDGDASGSDGAQPRCGVRVWSAISSMAKNFISTMAGRARWTRLSACTGGSRSLQQSYEALGAAGQAAVVEFVKSL